MDFSFLKISVGISVAGLLNMLPVTIMGLGTRELVFFNVFAGAGEPMILALSGLVLIVAQIGGGIISFLLRYLFLFAEKKSQPDNSN